LASILKLFQVFYHPAEGNCLCKIVWKHLIFLSKLSCWWKQINHTTVCS